jgi:AcrR family transcriptional regulator
VSYHHGDLRNALVTAGVALLAEQGVDALSLREVARRAGVSHAAPYRHFADRQSLLAAIAEQGFALLNDNVTSVGQGQGQTARQRLVAALEAYLAFCKANPHHAELMFGALARIKPAHLEAAALVAFGSLVRLTEDALRDEPGSTGRDARAIALALWAQTHGFSVLAAHVDFGALTPGVPPDRVVRTVLEDTVRSLLRSPR